MTPTLLDFPKTLNSGQLAAVTHDAGPQLVLAGAGSGKTRVITYRIAWLVQECGVDPAEIAAVTFTNKAAGEMKERVEELLGLYPLPSFVGTFHRFALRLLRIYGERIGLPRGFVILDSGDQISQVKKALTALEISDRNFQPQSVLGAISSAKNKLLGPVAYEKQAEGFFQKQVAPVYRRYQELLRKANGVDFDDMIRLSVELLRQDHSLRERQRRRHRFLLVDEFQDTNHAQLALIHELSGRGGNLTAVGDEDQSIYRWRGAEISNILRFEDSFPGAVVRKLERNYRSTQNILDASGAVVERNAGRRGKTLWTQAGDGDRLTLYRARDEQDEARWVARTFQSLEAEFPLAEMAVLVRTKAQTRAFEEEFLRRRMSYTLIGGVRFYERAEIKDIVSYLRLVYNPKDLLAFNRVVNQPPRGIGRTTHQGLLDRAAALDVTPWEAVVEDDLADLPKRGRQALRRFVHMIEDLRREAERLPLAEVVRRVLEVTAYTNLFDDNDSGDRARLENIAEFVSAAQEFVESHAFGSKEEDLLSAFLDHASLASGDDVRGEGLSLMTLHSAKGLEFQAVVVAGLEEDVLPHFNAKTEAEEIEEERRLFYVGMTRARRRLFLSCCERRRVAGQYQPQTMSRFLGEVPERLLDVEMSQEPGRSPETSRRSNWSRGREQQRFTREAEAVYSFFGRKSEESTSGAATSTASAARSGGATSPGTATPSRSPAQTSFEPSPPSGTRPATELSLKRGMRVRHPSLGRGSVLAIEGEGEAMRLTVYFDGIGRRKIVAKYAQLEVLPR